MLVSTSHMDVHMISNRQFLLSQPPSSSTLLHVVVCTFHKVQVHTTTIQHHSALVSRQSSSAIAHLHTSHLYACDVTAMQWCVFCRDIHCASFMMWTAPLHCGCSTCKIAGDKECGLLLMAIIPHSQGTRCWWCLTAATIEPCYICTTDQELQHTLQQVGDETIASRGITALSLGRGWADTGR